MAPGKFVDPDPSLEEAPNPAEKLGLTTSSGYNAIRAMGEFRGANRIFDTIMEKLDSVGISYEDQCTAKYYFDVFRSLRDFNGEFTRVVEVGVFMGGATSILAGASEAFDFDIDLVDVNRAYLEFPMNARAACFPKPPSGCVCSMARFQPMCAT